MTEADVFRILESNFGLHGGYLTFPQIRNGTGFQLAVNRTADALIVSTWPSKGIYFHGCEIKCKRADWLRELKDMEKSKAISQYCEFWSVVAADETIVKKDELPEGWGLLVVDAEGEIKTLKLPLRQEAKAPSKLFVAAILRKAKEHMKNTTVTK
jgi:hypothetical protein